MEDIETRQIIDAYANFLASYIKGEWMEANTVSVFMALAMNELERRNTYISIDALLQIGGIPAKQNTSKEG